MKPLSQIRPSQIRLSKKRLAHLVLSLLLVPGTGVCVAQEMGPIDLDMFSTTRQPPVNPLPGDDIKPSLQTGRDVPSISGSIRSDAPAVSGATAPESTFSPLLPDSQGSKISKPATSFDANQSATTSVMTSSPESVVYEDGSFDGQYEGEVYEGVVGGEVYETHSVLGLSAIGFERNYGDDRLLSNNFTDRGDTLTTGDADHNRIGGFETYLNCRSSSGVGWEFRYFGLDPSDNTATLGSDPSTVLVGLNDIATAPGDPSVATIFANGNFHSLTRESSIYNFEFNFLRNRSDIQWFNGRLGNVETMTGFRYIDFDESLEYASASDTGTGPRNVAFNSSVENRLYGMQTGARSEFCLFNRLSGSISGKLGLFYTDSEANRTLSGSFANGSAYSPRIINGSTTATDYNFNASDNGASFLGELDLGLIYQLSQAQRLRFGYRTIGISELAFASNNIPDDVANVMRLQEVNNDQSLRLRGIYFAYELAF